MKLDLALTVLISIGIQTCTPIIVRHKMSSSVYQYEVTRLFNLGYRLKHVSAYSNAYGNDYYTAIWVKTDGRSWIERHRMTSTAYEQEFNTWKRNGYHLVLVTGYAIGSTPYYAAIWEKTDSPSSISRVGLTSGWYQHCINFWTSRGYRPTYVSGYTINGVDYYAAIWQKTDGREWVHRHRMSSAYFAEQFNHWVGKGYRLVLVSGYQRGGSANYAAVWEKIKSPTIYVRWGVSGANYQAYFDNEHYRGYELQYVVAYRIRNMICFAAIWSNLNIWTSADLDHIDNTVNKFLTDNGIPGGALAITKNGKLVFAQGYGKADVASDHNASPTKLWRIASISKPITAVAIMKLKELGKLKLSDKIFGTNAILGNTYNSGIYSSRVKAITIQHLLEHTAGGTTWNNDEGDGTSDPMFIHESESQDWLISYIIKTREPSHPPGTLYSYSNFGYCILGRVIEKLTGQKYNNWVNNKILKTSGTRDMHIGKNIKSQKRWNEVVYYPGDSPYTMNVERMDSHGGWIASPIDLLRFMVHSDGFNSPLDILNPSTISTMITPSTANSNYAKGWFVNNENNWWHDGSLPGTMSILVRTSDGYAWSFVCSKRGSGDVDSLMWQVKNGIKNWPAANFF